MEGVIATAIVMVQRAGGTVSALTEEPGRSTRDIQTGPQGVADRAEPDRLPDVIAKHSAAVAWFPLAIR